MCLEAGPFSALVAAGVPAGRSGKEGTNTKGESKNGQGRRDFSQAIA